MSGITAVILSYNKAPSFPRFLRSFQRQTMKPEQVIVVDDASRDGVRSQLDVLPNGWRRIYFRRNRGQSVARNEGAKHANREFIIFLDGDIEMHPSMLAFMREALRRHTKASFAYCHYNRAGARRDPMRAKPWCPSSLRTANYISTMSLMRRRDMPVPPFDAGLRMYEDWDLWRRMAVAGKVGVLVDHILFTAHYTRRDISGRGENGGWYKRVLAKRQGP